MTCRFPLALASFALVAALAGCGPDYSPNTYNPAAVQQAAKVDRGIVVGFRQVQIRADGTVGAVTGGAAGGLVGAQAPGSGFTEALGALGGTVIGGIVGSSVEREADDTDAWEYIVRQTDGSLLSVTQKDKTPLAIGQHVLVIAGKQARIVPDYTVNLPLPPAKPKPVPPPPPVAAASLPPLAGATPDTPAAGADKPGAPAAVVPAMPALPVPSTGGAAAPASISTSAAPAGTVPTTTLATGVASAINGQANMTPAAVAAAAAAAAATTTTTTTPATATPASAVPADLVPAIGAGTASSP